MKQFVLVDSQYGPQPQLWHERPLTGEGKDQIAPLFEHNLTPQEAKLVDDGTIGLSFFVERFKHAA